MIAATSQLARFVVGSDLSKIPHEVVHEAERAFVNWMGCVLGGCSDPSVDILLSALEGSFGKPVATVIGRKRRADVPNAALLNCLSSSVHGFDDTHPATVIHPTGPVASALLAVAENHATSGSDFLHSLILGIEVECRLGNALIPAPAQSALGFLPTGLTGAIGAAVAVAKLRGLPEHQMIWSIGIAAGSAGGLRAAIGSMAAPYFLASTARNGVVATLLAEEGFTAPNASLEGTKGFAATYGNPANIAATIEALGERFELSSNTYKPYPCGVWVHPTVDVCLELVRARDIEPAAIKAVRLTVNCRALAIAGCKEPTGRVEAQASLYHWAAAALIRHKVSFAESEDACVRDAEVVALRRRIEIVPDSKCALDEAMGEIHLSRGPALKAHVRHCRGSLAKPMSDSELSEKFLGQAQDVLRQRAATELMDQCWNIGKSEDVGGIVRKFFPDR
jgi:2-methylcitrate dehydratase PrpD